MDVVDVDSLLETKAEAVCRLFHKSSAGIAGPPEGTAHAMSREGALGLPEPAYEVAKCEPMLKGGRPYTLSEIERENGTCGHYLTNWMPNE